MKIENEREIFPLFTVIIPVKNRAEYLHHTLRTCMVQDYEHFEIIVSDDGSTDNTREVVENAMRIDTRIRYHSHDTGIGMRDNFEFALSQVRPGYVIALGGDDGLLPGGIQGMYEVLRDTGMELLAWPAALYSFPNVYGPNGQIVIYHQKGVKIINSNQFLDRQAKNLYYLTDVESPMFYIKGVASTKLIDRVKSRSVDGRFYACPTPDGYSGIVLAGEVSQYAFSGAPFSIGGMSSSSQGLAYQSNDEQAIKESEIFFKYSESKRMHSELASQPYSPLVTLMTVDYLLTARDLPGWSGQFKEIDYEHVLLHGISELSLGMYGERRICRELQILMEISKKHGLEDFFLKKVRRARRMRETTLFDGNGISPKVFYIDAKPYGVNNIFDAAYAASNIYKTYSEIGVGSLIQMIARSLMYRFRSRQKGNRFPIESEWGRS